ncbi:hypothetical protein B0H12DRAFT_545465 [Mycena haematopus]|nr:hypothetical protein B0H12DRAFT_545465 [Mycena haematopus]
MNSLKGGENSRQSPGEYSVPPYPGFPFNSSPCPSRMIGAMCLDMNIRPDHSDGIRAVSTSSLLQTLVFAFNSMRLDNSNGMRPMSTLSPANRISLPGLISGSPQSQALYAAEFYGDLVLRVIFAENCSACFERCHGAHALLSPTQSRPHASLQIACRFRELVSTQ